MEKNKEAVRKPVETRMYWWLNKNRPFYIGDEYRIDLIVNPFMLSQSVQIVVTNLKNHEDSTPGRYEAKKKSGKKVSIDE